MKLSQLLDNVPISKLFQTMYGRMVTTHDVEVHALQYDSRKIKIGDCFVAIRGSGTDGHKFLHDAIGKGAKVIVVEDDNVVPDSLSMHSGVVKVVVEDSRKALAMLSANYYGHPSKRLTMIGVTGTNGKTTTTHILRSILDADGQNVGLIGTIEYKIGNEGIPASHTTPESLELNELLNRMVTAGCTSVSMEVSSHALHQSRVYGLIYKAAVFTNLSQDHLDYHGTMEDYFLAKKVLFESLPAGSWTITNRDDDWGRKIFASATGSALSYGFDAEADVRVASTELTIHGTAIDVVVRGERIRVQSPLVGKFNVYNVVAAFATAVALGMKEDVILQGIESLPPVRGRFERITSPQGWTAIIDYAHTPDALEKCLKTIHEIMSTQHRGKVITVFGAGGDRDKTKRPLMGKVAGELSDICIVTSDNPRTEDPQAIIRDILGGIPHRDGVIQQIDRRKAIGHALGIATSGDVVLVAGKGHEDYQVLGTEKVHFSDREVVQQYIEAHS